MTDQETIAALVTELERLGKLSYSIIDWAAFAQQHKGGTLADPKEIALAALSGIAAEVCAEEGYYIVKSGKSFSECDEDGNEIWDLWCFEIVCHDWLCGNTPISQHDAYHAALIAALKQVEKEEVKP